jgi:hypothetical protein
LLALFVLVVLTPQFAQDTLTNPPGPDPDRRAHIFGLLKAINTAEIIYESQYRSFGTWQDLLPYQPQYFEEVLSVNGLPQTNVRSGEAPETLPGWNLRLNVHTDGHGYDVLIEDVADKSGYAALSDERALIRECHFLDRARAGRLH